MNKTLFKSIFRNLWRNRITSIINILGLTMGLSSCLFLYVDLKYENTFDTHQPKADRIYRVNITKEYPSGTLRAGNTESMLAKAIKNEFPDLAGVTQITGSNVLLAIDPGTSNERLFEEERAGMFFADSLFLKHFEYDFIAGNPKTALDDPSAIILSRQLAEKYYPAYVGKEIELLGKEIEVFEKYRAKITGVIENPPKNTNFPFKGLASIEIYYKANEWDRDNWFNISQLMTFVILQPNQEPTSISSRFPALIEKYRGNQEGADLIKYSLLNLKELHNTDEWGFYVGNYTSAPAVTIGLVAIGLFILLSACINFINLQTAQSINRAKEVGVRKVLGSSRGQLIFQFLLETAILTTVSFLFALWITEFLLNAWNELLSIVEADLQLDWSVVGIGIILIMLVTLISGIYPAIKLSSFKPVETLKSNSLIKSSKSSIFNLRQVLVVLQFIISQILIISTIVIAYQMSYFLNKDLGFKKGSMLCVVNFEPDENQINQLIQGINSMPEISSFAISSGPPLSNRYNTTFKMVDSENTEAIETVNKFVDHQFIDHYGLELIAGRNFRRDEIDSTLNGFIVNEALANYFQLGDPNNVVGKYIDCYGTKAPIVGVIKNYHHKDLKNKIGPLILFPYQRNMNMTHVKVGNEQIGTALPKLRKLWKEVFPKRAFSYDTIDDILDESYVVEEIMFKSIRLFTIVAILIGCLGLYALVSFMAIQKTKEIGIRKVLGASYLQVLNVFTKKFFILVFVAFAIAAPLSYQLMNLWLSSYPYRITLGWEIFVLSLFITLLLTVLTVGYISLKATRTNPAETLQYE